MVVKNERFIKITLYLCVMQQYLFGYDGKRCPIDIDNPLVMVKGKEFGEEGIIQTFKDTQDLTSQKVVQELKGSLSAFVGRTPQHDDITLMALKAI